MLGKRKVEKADESLDDRRNHICDEWSEVHPFGNTWVQEVYDDHVIVSIGYDEWWSVPYTQSGEEVTFSEALSTKVEQVWTEVAARDITFEVRKTDESKQLVFGWASVAKDADGKDIVDSQGDLISPDDLEMAAYAFTLNYREGDEMHTEEVAAHLVESMMFTPEKLEKLGLPEGSLPTGLWTGFWIPDPDIFAKVQDGTYKMFSIGGIAQREAFEEVA